MNRIEKALKVLNSIVADPFDREMKTALKTINKVFEALKENYADYDDYGEDGCNITFSFLSPKFNKGRKRTIDTKTFLEWLEK